MWNQWKEIEKPQWRKCTNEELEIFKDCWFSNKRAEIHHYQAKPTMYNIKAGTIVLNSVTYDCADLFLNQEVYYNGKWQPVGILG